jgi:hypothetical protein
MNPFRAYIINNNPLKNLHTVEVEKLLMGKLLAERTRLK